MKKLNLIILIALILSLLAAFPVFAQDETPPTDTDASGLSPVSFTITVIAILAFIKARLPDLVDWQVLLIGTLVAAVVWFEPKLSAAYPLFHDVYLFIVATLRAFGSWDGFKLMGQKIAASSNLKPDQVKA